MTSFPLHPDTPLTDAQVEALSASPGMDRLLAMVRRDPALCDALPAIHDALLDFDPSVRPCTPSPPCAMPLAGAVGGAAHGAMEAPARPQRSAGRTRADS